MVDHGLSFERNNEIGKRKIDGHLPRDRPVEDDHHSKATELSTEFDKPKLIDLGICIEDHESFRSVHHRAKLKPPRQRPCSDEGIWVVGVGFEDISSG